METSLRKAMDDAADVCDREIMTALRKHEKQLKKAEWLWEKSHTARKTWDVPMSTLLLDFKASEYAKAIEEADAWAEESKKIREKADAEKREAIAAADKKFENACSEARKLYK